MNINHNEAKRFSQHNEQPGSPTIIAKLRNMAKPSSADFRKILQFTERQANEFLRLSGVAKTHQPTSISIVTDLPRVRVVYERAPQAGMSHFIDGTWFIVVNTQDSPTRQRFTLMHEFKHVIDHLDGDKLYAGRPWLKSSEREADAIKQRERAANHFAGCVLMPAERVMQLWASGVRQAETFATYFDVSVAAARVRLEQVGLVRPRWMCTRGAKPITSAFSAAAEEVVEIMRQKALQNLTDNVGRPSMRERRRFRNLRNQEMGEQI